MFNQIQNPHVQIIRYGILGLLIFLPSYLIRFSIFGIPSTILEIAIYLLFTFYFLVSIFSRVKFVLPNRRWLWPIGVFMVGALIGVLITPDKRTAIGQFKGFIVDPILFAWLIYSALRSGIISPRIVINSLIVSGVLVALGALVFPRDDSGRALSIYFFDVNPSPNYLALYLSPLAAMSVVAVIANVGEKSQDQKSEFLNPKSEINPKFKIPNSKSFVILASLIMVIAIILSGSRGGLLGVGVGVLVGLIIAVRSKTLKIALTFLTILTFLTSFWLTKPNLTASPDSGRVSSSNNIRYEIWTTTTEIITQSPQNFLFGVGLGNYQRYFTELTQGRVNYPEFIAPRALTPHNIFLTMWMNGGLLMLVGFVWVLVLYFGILLRSMSLNPKPQIPISNETLNPNIQKLSIPLIAAMAALLVHGLVDTPYFKNDLSVEFWLLVALVVSANQPQKGFSTDQFR